MSPQFDVVDPSLNLEDSHPKPPIKFYWYYGRS